MTITVSVKANRTGPAPSGPLVITPTLHKSIKPAKGTFPRIVNAYVTWNVSGEQIDDGTYIAIVPKPASGPVKWVNDDGYGNNPVYDYVDGKLSGTLVISIPCHDRRSGTPIPTREYVAFLAKDNSWEPAPDAVSEPFTVTAYVNPAA